MRSRSRTRSALGLLAALAASTPLPAAEPAVEGVLARAARAKGAAYVAARDAAAGAATESEIAAAETGGARLEVAARAARLLKYRVPTYRDLELRLERLLLVQQRQQKKSNVSFYALSGLLSPEAAVLLAERLLFEDPAPGAASAFWTGKPVNLDGTPPPDAERTRDIAARCLAVMTEEPLAERALIEAVRTEPPSPLREAFATALSRRATPALETRLLTLADGSASADEAAWLREVARRVAETLRVRAAEAN